MLPPISVSSLSLFLCIMLCSSELALIHDEQVSQLASS